RGRWLRAAPPARRGRERAPETTALPRPPAGWGRHRPRADGGRARRAPPRSRPRPALRADRAPLVGDRAFLDAPAAPPVSPAKGTAPTPPRSRAEGRAAAAAPPPRARRRNEPARARRRRPPPAR